MPQGNVVEVVSRMRSHVKGSDVHTTLKSHVQYVADKALADMICPDGGAIGLGQGHGAARWWSWTSPTEASWRFPAIPRSRPSTFVGGITQRRSSNLLQSSAAFSPLLNRAIQGTYPAASTYKTFTGLAALENGMATATETWDCTGSWDGFGSGDVPEVLEETGPWHSSTSAAASSIPATPCITISDTSSGMPLRTRASRQRCCRIS